MFNFLERELLRINPLINLQEYDFETIWEEKYREYRTMVAANQCSNQCQNKRHCRGKCVYFDQLTLCYRPPLTG